MVCFLCCVKKCLCCGFDLVLGCCGFFRVLGCIGYYLLVVICLSDCLVFFLKFSVFPLFLELLHFTFLLIGSFCGSI